SVSDGNVLFRRGRADGEVRPTGSEGVVAVTVRDSKAARQSVRSGAEVNRAVAAAVADRDRTGERGRRAARADRISAVQISHLQTAADGRGVGPFSPKTNNAPADAIRNCHIASNLMRAAADCGGIVAVTVCNGQGRDLDIPGAASGEGGEIPSPVNVQSV